MVPYEETQKQPLVSDDKKNFVTFFLVLYTLGQVGPLVFTGPVQAAQYSW